MINWKKFFEVGRDRLHIFIWPFAYTRVCKISCVTFRQRMIYSRVGQIRFFFGRTFNAPAADPS